MKVENMENNEGRMTAIENKLDTVIELLALLIEIEAGDKLWSFGEKTRKLERIIRRSK